MLFINCKEFKVISIQKHECTVKSSFGVLQFWNANKFYAWASEGKFTDQKGIERTWDSEMPSRYAVRLMAKKLKPHNRFFL